MERQFTYVKRFAMQDHPFRDFGDFHRSDNDRLSMPLPALPPGKHPEIVIENCLTLYCLQDEH